MKIAPGKMLHTPLALAASGAAAAESPELRPSPLEGFGFPRDRAEG